MARPTRTPSTPQRRFQRPCGFKQFLLEYGEHICEALGDEIDRIEARIQEAVPAAKFVDLEAD